MAGGEVKRKKAHRKHGDTRTYKSHKRSEDDTTTLKSVVTTDRPADIDALRKARLAYIAKSPDERRKEMKYEYVKRSRTVSQVGGEGEKRHKTPRHRSPDREGTRTERRSTKRRTDDERRRTPRDDSEDEYVYEKPKKTSVHDEAHTKTSTRQRTKTAEPNMRGIDERRRIPERRHTEPARQIESQDVDQEEQPRGADQCEPPQPQRPSTVLIEKPQRPSLKRSATSTRPKTEVSSIKPSEANVTPKKAPSLLSGFLPPKPVPAKKVSCLTCGADDIPISQSARLPCTHRMCNSCLKRIFTMSVKDPAHMPPRCCTDQHIDLKHVDKLFDQKFKVLWNRKFDEYKTKNRIYCPARKCGAWIKPHYITVENGRKVGRCKQCKTRVCAICSQKMHTTRDCPKDPATKAFVEVAKAKGWQRCYNCSAMVELKEGCNHMTCRCTAEFCMVCGLKWKSCDCPWFNYEAVDEHLGDPVRYQQELDRRRDQIDRDEALARRMQQMGLGGNGADDREEVLRLGNAANHHMNQNFIQQAREALTANYAQAGQAARDLLNGFVMGRENRLPGMPMQMDQMLDMLGQGRMHDPAEEMQGQGQARGPGRRPTVRRRTAGPDAAGNRGDEERRFHDWANNVAA
ncbi:uncharacterized protein Z518_09860 [Rhinocladiella mackenziei CBS 650.93]|uniref:RBR-type E3 ubiquitin transferase n=1 Tax=Rhinocladiella mackenziei CBS 650.93 TaxID=1442369 RepID=A0A0D2IVR8_9EURO|nr:uncharacterized protein Z518_09860 [Rhinocladiella mackenziei CBS 650.93]KIX00795.1 hypothetical protein Z518_09860 [Rhinocladiella mackenziei CBS 650.93]